MPLGFPVMNDLQEAVFHGSTRRAVALLARGQIDINERTSEGQTALMIAGYRGHSGLVRLLLDHGAEVSVADEEGFTALLLSAQNGHPASADLLVKAGAGLEVVEHQGLTALQLAAYCGHSAVMEVLIKAGSNPNARAPDGATPLFNAAFRGHLDAVKQLLRAKANPLFSMDSGREKCLPLDAAALKGHSSIVRELVREHGIKRCGGPTGGVHALRLAAEKQHQDILTFLTDVGVVDTGVALVIAAEHGREGSVKFLLRQQEIRKPSGMAAYADSPRGPLGRTALLSAVLFCDSIFPRVVRRLIDAGASTSSIPIVESWGSAEMSETPLATILRVLSEKKDGEGTTLTEEQLRRAEAVRRLLLQVEAARAASWLWPGDSPCVPRAAAKGARRATAAGPTPVTRMLPVLRRRATRRGVLLASMFRHSKKG